MAAEAQLAPGALPTQGQVVAGQSTISQSGNQMTINQGSQRAAINWGSYNIGSAATVSYNQPNAQSISLNRVVGGDPSQILGGLRANGQVWLINPNGILFGQGARVDVAGLVAATANISDREFMTNTNGRFVFDQAGRADAAVVNRGEITVREAGIAAFVAPGVQNSGTISASLGRVGLASANTYTLDLYGDRLINIAVSDRVMGNAVDAQGNPVRAGVENSGRIMADGGRVEVSANVARGVVDNVIRMGGIVQARSASVARNGDIILDGGDGAVEVSGQLDASGRGAGQTGGRVRVRGERISIMPTVTVDVAGDTGGGSILIGGGLRGAGPEPHAQNVTVAAGAAFNADAINTGRGGTIVVWSDGTTAFDGAASARGGAASGDGGLIETSGHTLTIGTSATISTMAPNGATGLWLLDPVGEFQVANVCAVNCITPATLVANLNSSDVTIVGASAADPMRIVDPVDATLNANPNNLTFISGDFHLDASIWLSFGGGNLTINNSGIFTRSIFADLRTYSSGRITLNQNAGGNIQDAINAVADYWEATINVGPGVYEPIHIDRSDITINGARRDQDPTSLTTIDPSTQTVIDAAGSSDPGIWITANYATVNGVTVVGSRTAGILVDPNYDGYDIHGTIVVNNYIRWNSNGVILGSDGGYGGVFATVIDRNRIEENNLHPGETNASFGHGIVLRGRTGLSEGSYYDWFYGYDVNLASYVDEGTAITRNLIINNVGHGIFAPSYSSSNYGYSSYGYANSYNHFSLAIAGNRIVNPGETGIQFGGLDTTSYGGEGSPQSYDYVRGTLGGAVVVLNTIENAFACAVAGSCQVFGGFSGEGGVSGPDYFSPHIAAPVGLRGAIDFRDLYVQRYFNGFGGEYNGQYNGSTGFITGLLGLGLGQAGSLLGLGVPTSDIVAMLNGPSYQNDWAGYFYWQPSVYIGFNAISGSGYGVSIHSSVDLGQTVVYINNNHLANNDKGGLLYALTVSYYCGQDFYDYCDFSTYCGAYETGRVVAAGNWWGDRPNQLALEEGGFDPNSVGNLDTSDANLGNLGPTFTTDVFDNTDFRSDVQGTGAVGYWDNGFGGEGVVVSAWRLDGNNQVARLNELAVNGQNLFGVGSEYPFPITLQVGGQVAGYLPTNTVRVGDWWNLTPAPALAEVSVSSSYFGVWRGPGGWDPAGRITRGVSVIREPLPLVASLIGTTISGGTDNGVVDVLPGHYYNEGSYFVADYSGLYGVVLVDKNNLTIQATVFGVQTPATPAGLIPGTAGAYSYNPDDFDGTLAGRAFPFGDPNFPTRNGTDYPTNTYEAVLYGGVVVVPNVVRGLIGALASGAETPEAGLSAFSTAAATNNFTLSGMVVAGGFNIGQLAGYFGEGGYDYKAPLSFGLDPYSYGYYGAPTVGVLLASGQNHTIRNNRIVQYYYDECGEGCEPVRTSVQSNGYGGEGSIGILIAPGDALLAGLAAQILNGGFGGEVPLGEIVLPTPPATGTNTVIAQNDIVGWNTAGVMVGIPGLVELNVPVTPATGVQILRNAIMETCDYGCYVPEGEFGIQQIGGGGAAVVLSEGTGATVQNNWIRNNQIGVVNLSEGPVVINENSFESLYGTVAIENLAANPLAGINNWLGQSFIFGLTQTVSNFTDTNPAPDRFDHNPLLPGWQIGASVETTEFSDPTFGRIPADGPFSFLADPFNANQPLGGLGGAGPSLQEIAPAAGGQGASEDQCANVPGEQLANILLGGFNLLNPAVYQQVIRCQAAAAQ